MTGNYDILLNLGPLKHASNHVQRRSQGSFEEKDIL